MLLIRKICPCGIVP